MLRKDTEVIRDTSSRSFEDDLTKVDLAVVDFWAPWCGPCRRISEIIQTLTSDPAFLGILDGKVKVGFFKVNVDEEPSLAQKYQVMSLPYILGFSGVLPLDRFGGRTKEDLFRWIQRLAERIGEKHGENARD